MSFFGPNAVVDNDTKRVYDYKENRADLESSGAPNGTPLPAGPPGVPGLPQMMPQAAPVPLQSMADLWKNSSGPANPQEVEQMLRARQMQMQSMWMIPYMQQQVPNQQQGQQQGQQGQQMPIPGQMPLIPGMPPMPCMPGSSTISHMQMPGQSNQQMPPMPIPGQMPLMPGMPMSMWPPMGFPSQWAFPPGAQGLVSGAPPVATPTPEASQVDLQELMEANKKENKRRPKDKKNRDTNNATPRSNRTRGRECEGAAATSSAMPNNSTPLDHPGRAPRAPSAGNTTVPPESAPVSAPTSSGAATAEKPYSLQPKTRVAASSIAGARENANSRPGVAQRSRSQTPSNSHQQFNDAYLAESEAIRPNRRFRRMMSDHDKRHVMENCLKSMAHDDPFVDDYYFHLFQKLHGSEANSARGTKAGNKRPNSQYHRVFNKGEGTLADRMRQQVQRSVDRARQRAKSAQEDGEKRVRKHAGATRPRQALPALSNALGDTSEQPKTAVVTRESTLRAIERIYDALLALEAHTEKQPAPTDPSAGEWTAAMPGLQDMLWQGWQVQKQVDRNGKQPFVEMILLLKGMKAFARSWSYLNPAYRLTVLTRLMVNIKEVDVTAKNFELFGQTVVQPLVHLISEADFDTILQMADLAQSRASSLAINKAGQLFLTAIVSRGEMLASAGEEDQEAEAAWSQAFAPIFDGTMPVLEQMDVRDDQVWHFFAALALGSDLERQSALVGSVKKHIFAQQSLAKQLGGEAGERKIAALNLFLNVMGLNATAEGIEAVTE